MPFLNYGKWIILALVAAFIGILLLRVANLKTEVAERDKQIIADNATITKYQEDQAAKREVIAALQGQVKDSHDVLSKWQARANEQDKIIARLRNQPAGPKQAAKEVVDDEGSALAVADLNRGWGFGVRAEEAECHGVSGFVHPVPASPEADAGTARPQ